MWMPGARPTHDSMNRGELEQIARKMADRRLTREQAMREASSGHALEGEELSYVMRQFDGYVRSATRDDAITPWLKTVLRAHPGGRLVGNNVLVGSRVVATWRGAPESSTTSDADKVITLIEKKRGNPVIKMTDEEYKAAKKAGGVRGPTGLWYRMSDFIVEGSA